MLLTSSVIPVVSLGILFSLNGISIAYGTHSIPTTAALSLVLLWLFVAVPLTVGGTLLGRHMSPNASWPCRVHAIPGLIPVHPWYRQRSIIGALYLLLICQCCLIALLPPISIQYLYISTVPVNVLPTGTYI